MSYSLNLGPRSLSLEEKVSIISDWQISMSKAIAARVMDGELERPVFGIVEDANVDGDLFYSWDWGFASIKILFVQDSNRVMIGYCFDHNGNHLHEVRVDSQDVFNGVNVPSLFNSFIRDSLDAVCRRNIQDCPFCGAPALKDFNCVCCSNDNCRMMGPDCASMDEAIAAWNSITVKR